MSVDARRAKLEETVRGKLEQFRDHKLTRLDELQDLYGKIEDELVPLGQNCAKFTTDHGGRQVKVAVLDRAPVGMSNWATSQVCARLGAPSQYIRGLVDGGTGWGGELATHILNQHESHADQQRLMFRNLGGVVKGVLSDSYKRISTTLVLSQFSVACQRLGAQIKDVRFDDTQIAVDFVNPDVLEVPTRYNGVAYVCYGARLRNSDFGDGALAVQIIEMRAECTNLHIFETALRQVHLGGKVADDVNLRHETYLLQSKAAASVAFDAVNTYLSPESVETRMRGIQAAGEKVLEVEPTIKRLPVLGMTKGEAEGVQKLLTANNPDVVPEGPLTTWRLSQAISALANDTQQERRRRDLQEISGKLMKEAIARN